MWFINGVATWMKKVTYSTEAMRPTRNYVYDVTVIHIWKPAGLLCDADQIRKGPI